jgi:hypothetical protein
MNYNFRGYYDSGQNYNKLDVVIYDSGGNKYFFMCIEDHTSASPQTPDVNQDTDYWVRFNTSSNFPNNVDQFIVHTNIQASDKTNIYRYQELMLKTNRTTAEDDELENLRNTLRDKILLPEDFNKLQEAISNMQMFIKSEVEGYINQKQTEFDAELDKFTYMGTYSSSTTYNKRNIVSYNGNTYLCLVDGTLNIDPTNTSNWAKIAEKGAKGDKGDKGDAGINLPYKGEYDPTTTYNVDDLVTYNGSTYVCVQQSTGNVPTDTNYWKLFIARGASIVLTQLKNDVVLGSDSSNIPIGIPEFNASQDVLMVFKNSTYVHQGVDWDINPDLISIDVLSGTWLAGTEVNFVVLKNMQQSLIYTDGTMLQDNSVSDAKLMPDNKVGSLATLNTTDKSSAVAAINEVNDKIGDLSNLNTTDKSNVVNAVNEIKQEQAAHSADTTIHVTQVEKDTWNSMQKHKVTADDGSAINISGQDLNNIKTTGFYMGDNLANAPIPKASGNWCYVEVIRHNDNFIIQKAYKLNYGQNSLYMRRCENGVWSSWSEDLFQSVRDGKLNVRNAITNKGGIVADANGDGIPTFDELVAGINGISTGKKWASGSTVSNPSTQTFTFADGSTTINLYPLTVSGLDFKPSTIILMNTVEKRISLYSEINDLFYPKTVKLFSFTGNSGNFATYNINGDVPPANVTSTGFTLPVIHGSRTHSWLAIE